MNSNPLEGKRILLVDDEDFLREVLCEIFNSHGAITRSAENGIIALDLLKSEKFDAVISDIRMPGGDGLSLAENINTQLDYQPKIFLCSGFNDIPPEKTNTLDIVEIFTKPFSVDKMIDSVSQALQK